MIEIIIIAILQGLFEWLHISSSGQVMIVSINFFGLTPLESFSLAIWLHLGTALAVLVKYRKDYFKMIISFFPNKFEVAESDKKKRNWIIIATVGTAITAIPLYIIFKILIMGFLPIHGDLITLIIAGLLIITGILLLSQNRKLGSKSIELIDKNDLNKDSFISGLFQGISILPGISRSGITVSTLIFEDYRKDNALKISFLMSVPVVLASVGLDLIVGDFVLLDPLTIILATLISFGVGYASMELLLQISKKIQFGYFCLFYGIISATIILPFIIFSLFF